MADASIAPASKTCIKCLVAFPESDYKYRKDVKNSLICVHCFKSRKAREKNALIDKNPTYFKNWRKENPGYFKDWRDNNPGYALAKNKEWRAKNPDLARAHTRKSYKLWRLNNLEKARATDRVKVAKRRAREIGAEGEFSQLDIDRIYSNQKGKCANCRKRLGNKYHRDHIVPLIKGGSNWPENIQLLCPACNLRKSARCPFKWANMNGKLL